MHRHEHDENSAPNQRDEIKLTDQAAHLAQGIPGAEPPALEEDGPREGRRDRTAAGFTAIYETARFGLTGCAAAYFPETNVLVPIRSVAEGSNQPASKSVVISIQPSRLSGNGAEPLSTAHAA